MGLFKRIKTTVQTSRSLGNKYVEEFVTFAPESKQVVLKKKTVSILCQNAVSRIEQLESLEPHAEEGLLATIEHKEIKARVHFTPESITLKEDCVEGKILLLNPPELKSDSLVYRYLIAGWKLFLGGKLPTKALPEGVRVEKDTVYYSFPRNQIKILDVFFSTLEDGSTFNLEVKQGELFIEGSVALRLDDFKPKYLIELLNMK